MEKLQETMSSFSKEDILSTYRNIPSYFQSHPLRTTAVLLFCAFTVIPVVTFIVFVISSIVFTIIVATFWEAVLLLFALVLLMMVLLCTTCLASCFTGCISALYLMYLLVARTTRLATKTTTSILLTDDSTKED